MEGFGEAEENTITFQNLYTQESIVASENFHLISSLKNW